MISSVQQSDFWWLGQLYSVLIEFAGDPAQTISRVARGHISIPEDQANHLDHYYRLLIEKYPNAVDLEVMKVVAQIDAILSDKSRGGASFDEWFWTNRGFEEHPEWLKIRAMARDFMLR